MSIRITLPAWIACFVVLFAWTPDDFTALAAPDSDGDGTPDVDCATNPNDTRCSIELPLRWCALQGSLAEENPSSQAEPGQPTDTTSLALWRRHERPSDRIYIPQARVTLRSALDRTMRSDQFPVVRLHLCTPTGRWCAPDAPAGDASACNQAGETCAAPPMRCLEAAGVSCTADADCGAQGPCVSGWIDYGENISDYVSECDRKWEDLRNSLALQCIAPASKSGDSCTSNSDCDTSAGSNDGVCRGFPAGALPGIPVLNARLMFDSRPPSVRGRCAAPLANALTSCTSDTDCDSSPGSGDGACYSSVFKFATGWANPGPGSAATAAANRPAYFLAVDKSEIKSRADGTIDCETTIIGHEFGHTLGLGHPQAFCSASSSKAGDFCQEDAQCPGGTCDATDATVDATYGRNVMFQGLPCERNLQDAALTDVDNGGTPRLLANQLQWVKDAANPNTGNWPGAYWDPPGVIIPGDIQSFVTTDGLDDVPASEGFIDISALFVEETAGAARFRFRLVDPIDSGTITGTLSYWVLADLDNDPADTGVGDLPAGVPSTAFTGSDLVARIQVAPGASGPSATLWSWDGTAFMDVTDEFTVAALRRDVEGETGDLLFQYAEIAFPKGLRGPVADTFRVHALSHNAATGSVDILERGGDITGDGVRDEGRPVSLLTVDFPVCGVTPATAAPGDSVSVAISGLQPNKEFHAMLGVEEVAVSTTDGAGDATATFSIPVDAAQGLRLVTVGNTDTALTADCFVEVEGILPIILTPEISRNDPGQDHTVTATVRDASGDPLPGVLVSFDVTSGPNAGSGGICSFNADCTTDAQGMVSFTYTGDGGSGVDQISASFSGAGGTLTSNTALKFWDVDCNQNDIADTCDISCGGFGGLCGNVIGCGRSSDDNSDGVPDECNLPPDCGAAGAEPDELWPPSHGFKDITIAGVTDPDGDPVASVITSIFQDEAVDARGSGNTSPDGTGVGTSTAQVRAERTGTGDGRVYHIGFNADDGRGGQCTGEVTVCVPHDQRPNHFCVDQGPLYDSTQQFEKRGNNRRRR